MKLGTTLLRQQIRNERRKLRERAAALDAARLRLDPLLADLMKLGASVSLSDCVDVRLTGNRQALLKLLRTLWRYGLKPEKIAKGRTYYSEMFEPAWLPGLPLFVTFSSNACRSVQIGTKTVEQPIYETVCE